MYIFDVKSCLYFEMHRSKTRKHLYSLCFTYYNLKQELKRKIPAFTVHTYVDFNRLAILETRDNQQWQLNMYIEHTEAAAPPAKPSN